MVVVGGCCKKWCTSVLVYGGCRLLEVTVEVSGGCRCLLVVVMRGVLVRDGRHRWL